MYVNQIDSNIDEIIDQLFFNSLSKDQTYKALTTGSKINFVENREKINEFIDSFTKSIDQSQIKKIITDKNNIQRIINIIKRYVAYYYFLSIGFYYSGNIKDFRNNIIQYSKLQTTSNVTIYNFFDSENNYQLINYFRLIRDVKDILLMTDLQKKTLNVIEHKESLQFLNSLGREYIDSYILKIVNDTTIEVNAHNLIKTLVFREIYLKQDKKLVYDILNESEESQNEYIYIDVVVSNDDANDFERFKSLFIGDDDADMLAEETFELVQDMGKPPTIINIDKKNSTLIEFPLFTPIVDDFLRYHKDSERTEVEGDTSFKIPISNQSNSKNIQMLLLNQQRKKKDNTKAQIIVNKLDAISDLYSDNAKKNTEYEKEIKKNLYAPFANRKVVLHNYSEEVHVLNKIINQGQKAIEGNEYFLELSDINSRAYFNFKDFQSDGTSINVESTKPINLLRYTNIEYKSTQSYLPVETHTTSADSQIQLVGLSVGPFSETLIQCVAKEHLVDIREIEIAYMKNGAVKKSSGKNGFKMFSKIFKHFYLDSIKVVTEPHIELIIDYSQVKKLNPGIYDKVIHWVYNIETDEYQFDTYENIKTNNNSDVVKYINSAMYDRIQRYLKEKLLDILAEVKDMGYSKSNAIIDLFTSMNKFTLNYQQKRDMIITEVLSKYVQKSNTQMDQSNPYDSLSVPEFSLNKKKDVVILKIDTRNPFLVREFIQIEDLKDSTDKKLINTKCEHENVWKSVQSIRNKNINQYNQALTDFIEEYITETIDGDFVCRICGQVLPIKRFVQDGSFDNNTQRFITAYVPSDIPLEENIEYRKYTLAIKYLDNLINRISLITNTNMLVGQTTGIKQKRKTIVKNIIDIFNKNNLSGMNTKENKTDILKKKYGIEKDFNSVIYFNLDDSIFNFTPSGDGVSADLNRYKFNNILLYFMFVFMTELTSAQIGMMNFDKIGNVYTFLKYGPKLFNGLSIRKNITDGETSDIMNYPILCYLIFILSYFLIKYKFWFYPSATNKTFNPVVQKIIIHSIVDIINNLSTDAGKYKDDYVYNLTSSKFYGHLNEIFRSRDLILQLKQLHKKFGSGEDEIIAKKEIDEEIMKGIDLNNPPKSVRRPRQLPSLLVSGGVMFNRLDDVMYVGFDKNSDATHGVNGHIHEWAISNGIGKCTVDGELLDDVSGSTDRTEESYYFNIKKIADRRCISGLLHDYEGIDGKFVCNLCKKIRGEEYTKTELDKLVSNLHQIEDNNIKETFEKISTEKNNIDQADTKRSNMMLELFNRFKSNHSDMLYGTLAKSIDNFVDVLLKYVGSKNDLIGASSKYPIYLKEDVFIIDHTYQAVDLSEPIILTESDKKLFFKENHQSFNRDIYYYTDSRSGQIDVFYDAITLELIGYKEKHKEMVPVRKANKYLKINRSIKDRLMRLGYESKYLDINHTFEQNKKLIKDDKQNMTVILDSLVSQHVINIKSIIDKTIEILYNIKYYNQTDSSDTDNLRSTHLFNIFVAKYAKVLENFNMGSDNKVFEDWNEIRDLFMYKRVNWSETTVDLANNKFISSDTINYYDTSSNIMFYYLLIEFTKIIDSNSEQHRVTICQMIVEIINNMYNLYNKDTINQQIEYKRFDYILSGNRDVTIDMMRKGLSADKAKQLDLDIEAIEDLGSDAEILSSEITEEAAEELEDLKEEAEALDVEEEYYADENEDYAE